MSVPVTITANTDCKGVLTAPFAPVMVTDNCDATPTVTWSTSGATNGVTGTIQVPVTQLFDLGTTYVSFTVTDEVGNSAKCTNDYSNRCNSTDIYKLPTRNNSKCKYN